MQIKQYFEPISSTYTYLIYDEQKKSAALIDPVVTEIPAYLDDLQKKQLQLLYVLDTHTHADHISANGKLREQLGCKTCLGKESGAACIDQALSEGDVIDVGSISIQVLHTPGHTDDSYCFFINAEHVEGNSELHEAPSGYLFTGDTLLINGSGRTDFQNGDARQQYDSIFNRLLNFPESTVVFPGHDYRGNRQSTIGHEKRHNPRLQVPHKEAYVSLMNSLNLPSPAMMDIAVPANRQCGVVAE